MEFAGDDPWLRFDPANFDSDSEDDRDDMFYDAQEDFPSPVKKQRRTRAPKVVRDRKTPWAFIMTWSDALFARQMRLQREVFFAIVVRLKAAEPDYELSIIRGQASTPLSGPITMEIKLCVFLRLLAGASYLDMIWYGVQLCSVSSIFIYILYRVDAVLTELGLYVNINYVYC